MPETASTVTASRVAEGNPGRGRVYDAGDPRHGGLPAWSQHAVPQHLLTRREMTAQGLRPGRQPVHGLVFWPSPAGTRCARLYDITQARSRLLHLSRRLVTARPG